MTVEAFCIENFMCFEDSGWVELRPIRSSRFTGL